MSLLSVFRYFAHFLRAVWKAFGCSLNSQPFPECNRWQIKASLVCHVGFLNVLEINGWHCMLSVVPADKKEMNSNRKYFQSINKHTSLGRLWLMFLLPYFLNTWKRFHLLNIVIFQTMKSWCTFLWLVT